MTLHMSEKGLFGKEHSTIPLYLTVSLVLLEWKQSTSYPPSHHSWTLCANFPQISHLGNQGGGGRGEAVCWNEQDGFGPLKGLQQSFQSWLATTLNSASVKCCDLQISHFRNARMCFSRWGSLYTIACRPIVYKHVD